MQLLLGVYLVIALVSIAISLPLMEEKVKPNPLYGFRVRATLENPTIWYAVNKHFGQRLLIASSVFLAASVALFFIPGISLDGYALGCLFFFLVPFMIGMSQSMAYLRSLTGGKG